MDKALADSVSEFAGQVGEMTKRMNAARGAEAEKLRTEVSLYIGKRMQELMALGAPVMYIQDAVRSSLEEMPQSYAPDADGDEKDDVPEEPVGCAVCFLPMDESVVADFASGKIGIDEMTDIICASSAVPLEMTEGLDLVLTDYGGDQTMEDITESGEIVAGSDGEAFIPEYLELTEPCGSSFTVAEPMVFKTAEEVRIIFAKLKPISKEAFAKKANIKKLIKSGWLDGYSEHSVRKEGDWIISLLSDEFGQLRDVYGSAAERGTGMLIFVCYLGDDTQEE